MKFTPPPLPEHSIKISIESNGANHRVLVENASSHPKTAAIQASLSGIGWQITQRLGDSYAVGLDSVVVQHGKITVLYEQIRNEYGLPTRR